MDGANFYSGDYEGGFSLGSLKTLGSLGLKATDYAVNNADKIQSLANTAGQVATVFKGDAKPQVVVSGIPTNNNSNESIPAQQTTTTGAGMSNAYEQFVGAKESQLIGGGSAVGAAGAGYSPFDNVADYTLADKATLEQLKRYENSGSMRAKRLLLKSLGRALSREFGWGKEFETTDDISKLSKMIRDKIPTVAEGKFPESSKAQEQALRKMANVINEVYGTRVINSQGDLQNLAPEVGEFVYSLATGLHTEFMVVQENVKTVMTNIVMLRAALKTAYNEIKTRINQANSDPMALADEVRPYDELYVRLEEELDRQHLMLQNLLSVTIEVGDRQLKQMLLEAADMYERVMNLDERRGPAGSDAMPGSNFYATTLAHILNTFANISVLAAQTDRALSKLGMTVSEYANTSSIKDLKSKIDKLYKQKLPGMKYNEAQTFLDSADIVTKSFGNHKKVAEAIKKMDKSVSGGYDDAPDNVGPSRNYDDPRDNEPRYDEPNGEPRYDEPHDNEPEVTGGAVRGGAVTRAYKSVLQRRLEQERRVRKLIFKQFSNEFARYIQAITTGISEFAVRVGRDLPSPPELNAFRDAVNKMTDIRFQEVYVALLGFNVSVRAKHIREKYQDRIRNLAQAAARLMAAPGMSGAAAILRDIKTLCDDVNQHIDRHSDMIATKYAKYSQKYIGMGEDDDEHNESIEGGVDFDGVIVGGSEVTDSLLDALDVPGESVSMVNYHTSVDNGGDANLDTNFDIAATLGGPIGAAEGDAAGAAGGDVIRPFRQPHPEDITTVEAELGSVPVIENVITSLKGANSLLNYNTYLTSFADNFKHTAKAIGEIEKKAEDVLAIAIAKKKHSIRAERDATLKALADTALFQPYVNKAGSGTKHEQRNNMYDNIADNLKGMYNTREDFYTLVEGIDTYLRTFTKDLAANAEKVREVKKVLDNHQVISRWFDESSGESLADLFEFFPYVYSAAGDGSTDGPGGFAADKNYASFGNIPASGGAIDPDDFKRLSLVPQQKNMHYYQRLATAMGYPAVLVVGAAAAEAPANTQHIVNASGGKFAIPDPAADPAAAGAPADNAAGIGPADVNVGNPYLLLDPILGPKLMEKVKDSTRNLLVLKNIVSAFSRIGDNVTSGSNLFINDAQIYDGLLKYLHFSSISFGMVSAAPNATANNDAIGVNINIHTPIGDSVNVVDDYINVTADAAAAAGVTAAAARADAAAGGGVAGAAAAAAVVAAAGARASNETIYTGIVLAEGNDLAAATLARQVIRRRYGAHMSSVYDGVGSNYKDEDELWVMIIKAMVAKILTVLGVSQMLTRPSGRLPGFQTVRQILGGAESDSAINDYAASPTVEEGALKLYFYLPRLLIFYRDLFTPDNDMKVQDWNGADVNKRISMTPDIEGTFSALIWLFFTQLDHSNDGEFSDAETRRILSEINKVYAKYRGQKDPTRAVVDDLVSEVNRRYGVITQEDQATYKKYKETLQTSDFTDPPNGRTRNYEILKNEGTEEATIVPPSSKYTLGEFSNNDAPSTVLDSRSPYDINKHNLLLITRFRESLTKALTVGYVEPRGGVPGGAPAGGVHGDDNHRQHWINSPYKRMLETCNTDFKRAGAENQRLKLAAKLIRANDVVSGEDHPRFVMMHETIATGLATLNAIYTQLCSFREMVAKHNFILRYALWITTHNNAAPNAVAISKKYFAPTVPWFGFDFYDNNGAAGAAGAGVDTDPFGVVGAAGVLARADNADRYINDNVANHLSTDKVNIMQALLENLLSFGSDLQDYVTVRFDKNGEVFINYAGLYDEIRNLMASMRYYVEFFRKHTSDQVLARYVNPSVAGSLYWLEENLVEKMFVKKSNESLASTTHAVSSMFKQLVTSSTGGAPAIAVAPAGGPAPPRANYEHVFRRILYYDRDAAAGLGGVRNSGVNNPARLTEGISPHDKIMSGSKAHRSFRFHDLYSLSGGLNETVDKSLMFGMNEAFAKYVSTAFDPVSQKVCGDMIREPAEGVFPRAVSEMASYPDTHVALFGHIRWLAQSAANQAGQDNEYMTRLKMILHEAGFITINLADPAAAPMSHVRIKDLTTDNVRSANFMNWFSEDKLLTVWEDMYSRPGGNVGQVTVSLIQNLLESNSVAYMGVAVVGITTQAQALALRAQHNLVYTDAAGQTIANARATFNRIVNVLKKYAPADPMHTLVPYNRPALGFKIRAEPDQNAVLFTSLADALRTMLSEHVQDAQGNPTDKLKYLVDSYVEMTESHKETMLAHLPLHAKTFDLLRRKAESILEVLNVNGLRLTATGNGNINHFPQKDINPGMLMKFDDNTNVQPYFVQLTHTIREACAKLGAFCDGLLGRMGDQPVFGETRRGEFEMYRKTYNKEPMVPISGLSYVFSNHGYVQTNMVSGDSRTICTEFDFLPIARRDDMKFRYIYSTRHLLGRSRAPLKAEHIAQTLKMLDKFPEMDKDRFMRHCGHLVNLTRFVHDLRHFRAQYVSIARNAPAAPGRLPNIPTVCGRVHLVGIDEAGVRRGIVLGALVNPAAPRCANISVDDGVRLGAAAVAKTRNAPIQVSGNHADVNRLDAVLLYTSSDDQKGKFAQLAGVIGGTGLTLSNNRRDIPIYTIIDLNIIPLNIHMLMGELALTNLYNYAYTYDRIVAESLGSNNYEEHVLRGDNVYAAPGGGGAPAMARLDTANKMFVHLLMYPFVKTGTNVGGGGAGSNEYAFFAELCDGNNVNGEFGRPKYLYDQIWRKVLLGGIGVGNLAPAAAANDFAMGHYDQNTHQANVNQRTPDTSGVRDLNVAAHPINLYRFHTTLVRKLVFLTLVHRFLRMKLQREVMFHDNIVLRDETLIDPHTTEYYNEQAFQSRYSHKYGEPDQLQFAPQSMEDQ